MVLPELDWYEVLGVDPSVSDAELGRAFRALARRYHPDRGRDASHSQFSDVARAWEVLGDPASRADYDRRRVAPGGRGVGIPVRRWAAPARQPPKVEGYTTAGGGLPDDVEVTVSFADALSGALAKVNLPSPVVCEGCEGRGVRSTGACPRCGGQGRQQRPSGSITITYVCLDCRGSGTRPAETCPACSGKGWRESTREMTVRVPAGVAEGTRLRIKTPRSGETAGYARVRIRPDPSMSRDGSDLVLRLPVTAPEAVLGCRVTAFLPTGPVDVEVPAGTQTGTRLRLPGPGVTGSGPGELVIEVEVVLPRKPTSEQRAALEALAAASPNPREGLSVFASDGGFAAGARSGGGGHESPTARH